MKGRKLNSTLLTTFIALSLAGCSSGVTEAPKEEKLQKKESTETSTTVHHETDWSYKGETGPEHWGDLNPLNSACINGKEQSPVNVKVSQIKTDRQLEKLEINYISSEFSLENNGHTIQGNPATSDNFIVLNSNKYALAQFHFHTPSEHQFNGQNFDMELHLVHKDAKNQLAVVGLMIKKGKANAVLEQAWKALPQGKTVEAKKLANPINLLEILPQDQQSFKYNGSLTTPPCSEDVNWIVLEQPIEMSKEQIDAFRQIFPDNHRPVQPLNEREINKN